MNGWKYKKNPRGIFGFSTFISEDREYCSCSVHSTGLIDTDLSLGLEVMVANGIETNIV